MKKIYFIEAFKNIKKNLFTSILLVICFVILFIIFHKVTIQALWAEETKKQAGIMSVVEYAKASYGSELSPRICSMALQSCSDEEIYAAGQVMDTIMTGLYEKFDSLKNRFFTGSSYDSGFSPIYCPPDMYKVSGSIMIIKEGTWFEDNVFYPETQSQEDWIAPVILGSRFAEKFGLSVGDVFVPDMVYDEQTLSEYSTSDIWRKWEVIGILEPQSSYYYRGSVTPLDSRALLPDFVIPTLDEFVEMNGGVIDDAVIDFILGLHYNYFRTTDFLVRKEVVEEAVDFISEQIATNEFLSEYYSAHAGNERSMTMIAENQKKASNFYNVIAVITYILTLLGIIMSVNNKIQNNKRNYAIHVLNGATVFDLIFCSVSEVMMVILIADTVYFLFPFRTSILSSESISGDLLFSIPLFVLIANILTFAITVLVSAVSLHNFDTVEQLKRKE